jgi:hypothetical protein
VVAVGGRPVGIEVRDADDVHRVGLDPVGAHSETSERDRRRRAQELERPVVTPLVARVERELRRSGNLRRKELHPATVGGVRVRPAPALRVPRAPHVRLVAGRTVERVPHAVDLDHARHGQRGHRADELRLRDAEGAHERVRVREGLRVGRQLELPAGSLDLAAGAAARERPRADLDRPAAR